MKKIVFLGLIALSNLFCFSQDFINGDFSNGNANWNDTGCQVETNFEYLYVNGSTSSNMVAEIDATNSLCQTVSGFNIGQSYSFTFNLTRRDNCFGSSDDAPNPMEIFLTIDGGVLNNHSIIKNGSYDLTQTYTISFVATQTNHLFSLFANQTQSCGMVVDNLSLTQKNALNFDGVDDYVEIQDNNVLDFTTDLTIEAWIKPVDLIGQQTIVSKNYCNSDFSYCFMLKDQALKFTWTEYGICNDANVYESEIIPNLQPGTCSHVSVVLSSTSISFYLDGNEVTGSFVQGGFSPIHIGNEPLRIGMYRNSANQYVFPFEGDIDELRLWNTARTQTEIQNNMNNELVGNESGLVVYYNFNQGVEGGNNTSITSVTNSTSFSGLNGDIYNMSLNGQTSNFVENGCKRPSGLEEISTTSLQIYPNPANSILNIEFSRTVENSQILIFDLSGKIVKSFNSFSGDKFQFEVSDLMEGVYYIQVISNNTVVSQRKFVKI